MQTSVLREYSWSWAKDQTEDVITQHLKSNPHDILHRLAKEALKIPSSEQNLQISHKILLSMTKANIEEDRIVKFLKVLRDNRLIPTESSKTAGLLQTALAEKNIPFAVSLIKVLEKSESSENSPFMLAREAMSKSDEGSLLFLLSNKLIKNKSQLKNLFAEACEKNLVKVVEFFLKKEADFEVSDELIEDQLREAMHQKRNYLALLLLGRMNFDFAEEMRSKSNLLNFACCLKPENDFFLLSVIQKYKQHTAFDTSLFVEAIDKASKKAALYANPGNMLLLIKEGASVDSKLINNLLYAREDEYAIDLIEGYKQNEYLDILMTAIRVGADLVIECILSKFEDKILQELPLGKFDLYSALLERAIQGHNSLTARLCLERLGENVDQVLIDKMLAEALASNSEGLLLLMVEKGYIPSHEYPKLLLQAVKEEFSELARTLLAYGTNVNYADNNGLTPLMLASARNSYALLSILLKNKGNVNAQDSFGNTPLHYAAYTGSNEAILLLLKEGALINMPNKTKYTPLHLAAEEGWDSTVNFLIENKADKNCRNDAGNTPLHLMVRSDMITAHTVSKLINNGCEVHIQNNRGETPFTQMIRIGRVSPILPNFLPYRKLFDNAALIPKLLNENQEAADLVCAKENLSYAIPLEISLLLNSYRLAHLIAKRYSYEDFAKEIKKLALRYPETSLAMIKESIYHIQEGHLKEGRIEFEPQYFNQKATPEKIEKIKEHLLNLFDLINFEDPSKPEYRNPAKLSNDGYPVLPTEIKKGLNTLFHCIRNRTVFIGTPPEGPELIKWYERLEQMLLPLCEIIAFSSDKYGQGTSIIDLGIAGMHCGGRWVGTVEQLVRLEMLGQRPVTLDEYIKNALQIARRSIIELLIEDGNVHQYNHALYAVGEELGLIKPGTKDTYKDSLAETEISNSERILEQFYKLYTPTFIINLTREKLTEFGRNGENRDIVIDWFKENLPDYWKKEEYEKLLGISKSEQDKLEVRQERLFTYLSENLWDDNYKFSVGRRAAIDFLIGVGILIR